MSGKPGAGAFLPGAFKGPVKVGSRNGASLSLSLSLCLRAL